MCKRHVACGGAKGGCPKRMQQQVCACTQHASCSTWVVFPQPVSPATSTTWCARMACVICSRNLKIGNCCLESRMPRMGPCCCRCCHAAYLARTCSLLHVAALCASYDGRCTMHVSLNSMQRSACVVCVWYPRWSTVTSCQPTRTSWLERLLWPEA